MNIEVNFKYSNLLISMQEFLIKPLPWSLKLKSFQFGSILENWGWGDGVRGYQES